MAKATRGNGKEEGPHTATKARQTARRPGAKPKPKTKTKPDGASTAVAGQQFEHQPVDEAARRAPAGPKAKLSGDQRVLLGDLFAVIQEHADDAAEPVDTEAVEHAFVFACERHADQRRASGEDFIVHPVGVAKICAGMRLDTATLCASLLHDTVEDTSASLAEDIRVILIKLADRLHNMRTLSALPKHKQQEIAKETLEIFAPLAHRLGIHAIKWELEDLAFATLHPRKYNEIRQLVNQQREEREAYVARAGEYLGKELDAVGVAA